jgi:hypothetical protein
LSIPNAALQFSPFVIEDLLKNIERVSFFGQPMIQEGRQISFLSLKAGNPEPGFFAGFGIRMLTFLINQNKRFCDCRRRY